MKITKEELEEVMREIDSGNRVVGYCMLSVLLTVGIALFVILG